MIITDVIESQSLKRDTNGYSADRSFIIADIPGTGVQKLYNAATMAGVPQYADPHPFLPEVSVTNISTKPLKDGSQAMVTVNYSVPTVDEKSEADEDNLGSGTIVFSSTTANESIIKDVNGDLLVASYAGYNSATGFFVSTKYAEAEIEIPQLRVTFTRTETSLPKSAVNTYLGKLNATPWSGYEAKTWICSGINARQNKGKFDIDYSFIYKKEGWELEVTVGITAADAAEVPLDVESGNGYARYQVYPTADFNALGLTF